MYVGGSGLAANLLLVDAAEIRFDPGDFVAKQFVLAVRVERQREVGGFLPVLPPLPGKEEP